MVFKVNVLHIFIILLGTGSTVAADVTILNDLLKIAIKYLTLSLKNAETISLGDIPLDLDILNNADFAGEFIAGGTNIYGFDTLNLDIKNVNLLSENGYITFRLDDLSVDKLGIEIQDYYLDIGLFNEVPLYGEGKMKFEIRNITLNINTAFNIEKWKFETLSALLTFRHSKVTITKFWNNEKLDGIVSNALTDMEALAAMFWDYNVECISCGIGQVVKHIFNELLTGDDILSFDQCKTSCFGFDSLLEEAESGNYAEALKYLKREHLNLFLERIEECMSII
ncbi:uncharacterized protein LOC132696778 [Cylas formicarius]|uniref:uncharacterized protein LOC132696778 n=1 Tax=Cylas formicarius TaxID=197179 RepID=UPI0029584B8B|nr:uncharacterized protein LOC132696778 [Cylas formicarius]